jgi:hypothetical protein
MRRYPGYSNPDSAGANALAADGAGQSLSVLLKAAGLCGQVPVRSAVLVKESTGLPG